jgi:hypothetical protein
MRENTIEEKENLLDNNTNEGNIQHKISNEKERNTNGNDDENIKNSEKLSEENVKPSVANEVIEDNIKTTDTLEFINKKKKESENNENNENDDLESDRANKKNNKKKKNNFKYHININKKFLKYFTLVTIILYIFIIIASSIVFHQRRESNPFLFCFKFLDRIPEQSQGRDNKDIIYFLTDLNSFYIIHLVLFIIFISVCYLLIKGSESRIDYFFKDMSIFFVSTLIFNIPILFSGMFTDHFYGNFLQPVAYLILTFLGFLCMVKIYIVAKGHKYKKISSLINISILSSFMTAYQCYCFLFNISYCYMNIFKPQIDSKKKDFLEVEIIAGCLYFAVGIVVMTVFKDIFFVIAMVIIENGLLYSKREDHHLLAIALVNISIVSLNFASVIILIFVYNKKIFKLKEKK